MLTIRNLNARATAQVRYCFLSLDAEMFLADLCVRVFKAKLKQLMKHITNPVSNHPSGKPFFGRVVARVSVIEFQKRGLPHAHILLILDGPDKPKTPEDYNNIVRAELPDKDKEPKLFEAVVQHMLHGPCGAGYTKAPCMVGGVCSKGYPKPFQEVRCYLCSVSRNSLQTTDNNDNGYPLYRRRDNGRTYEKRYGKKSFTFDNRWVVPYNPHLLLLTHAHTNVEICSTLTAYKYLYKYVYKGPDMAVMRLQKDGGKRPINEVERYESGRYLAASEACYRFYGYRTHDESPGVMSLAVHLPNHEVRFLLCVLDFRHLLYR